MRYANNKQLTNLYSISALALVVMLSGCGKNEPQEVAEPIRPVKTVVIEALGGKKIREFPGLVGASQRAEMSFRVAGQLAELPVREGDQIESGQTIARLDETDFKIALNDSKATYDKALADFKRAKELLPQGHISRSDYDKIDAHHKTAKANLNLSRQNLNYTTLTAPFTGTVARRYVDNFEEVSAKQNIVLLQDTTSLDIRFDIPERLAIMIDPSRRGGESRNIFAKFGAIKGKEFPLTFKEISTDADPQTRTYKVTFTMPQPEGFSVLPGMNTTVVADTSHLESSEQAVLLPVSAVISDSNKQATVWLVDQETMTVHPHSVEAGSMQGNSITVTGLKSGDRVVIAGVPFLRKGMKVSLLETGEQPE
ncbi:MAG: efflux RND transporter periplasmic adaptor subunit [Gammaproteobacteria bacterium]|nr:MAG: efflux RND transporter periplasmic adaptor subunit [Gammaproteobacteria bacterium]